MANCVFESKGKKEQINSRLVIETIIAIVNFLLDLKCITPKQRKAIFEILLFQMDQSLKVDRSIPECE